MKGRLAIGVAVVGALFEVFGADTTAGAAVNPSASLSEPVAVRWWAAFDDKVLDALLARGGSSSPTAELAVVRSYIDLRVAQMRLGLAEKLQQAAAQQRAMLEQATPDNDERSNWLNAAASRAQHWSEVQSLLAGDRDRAEVTLAALTRTEAAHLHDSLQAGAGKLPEVAAAVPQRLSTAGEGGAPAPLKTLQSMAAQAAQARQLMDASELELRARRMRQELGADTPIGVLEAYQHLVADADHLAGVTGALAVAWAQWLQSTGGTAVAAASRSGD